jgi:methyl-accepting chemotaxis protein
MFSKKGGKKGWGAKLFSLPALFVIVFLAGILGTLYFVANVPLVNTAKIKVLANQDMMIKNEVQAAVSLLDALNQKVTAGQLSLAGAKKQGADLLRQMRYGVNKDGYFFVDTTAGVNVVMLGDKSIEGRNRLNDSLHNVYYVKGLLAAGQQSDGGFISYWYPKPGESIAKEKRAYALQFKPFDWVVGTGYYLEDVK